VTPILAVFELFTTATDDPTTLGKPVDGKCSENDLIWV